jgi:hypothetical protein
MSIKANGRSRRAEEKKGGDMKEMGKWISNTLSEPI